MKIFETMHEKKPYWLVFDDNNEVVGKYETQEQAIKHMSAVQDITIPLNEFKSNIVYYLKQHNRYGMEYDVNKVEKTTTFAELMEVLVEQKYYTIEDVIHFSRRVVE